MATYYFELIEEGGTVYAIQMSELSIEFLDVSNLPFGQQSVSSRDKYRWLFHPKALKNIEFDVEVLDVIKLPIPSGYPGDQVYGEFIHVDLVYNPDGILAPDGNKYPFWIAYSPFPSMQSQYENPCVAYSKDGITWRSDFTLPLIEKPADSYSYNSDPELFELDDGRLCLINRQYGGSTYNLQFMIYTPNSGWSNPVTFASSSQDVLKCPSVVKDPSCGEREFVLFTTQAYTYLRRQTLTFSEDYSSATIGDAIVCNVINVDTGGPMTSDHVNIKFLNGQYVGIIVNGGSGLYNLYWVVSLDGYNFYAKRIILVNEIIGAGFPYRADFIIQEDGTILLYLPFAFPSGSGYNPFLFLTRVTPRPESNVQLILQPSFVAVRSVTSGHGYPGGKVCYYLSFVDKQGNESNKFYIGTVSSKHAFNVNISVDDTPTTAYKYRLYRSYNSDSILNITDVYPDLLDPGSSIVDNNSNWIPVSNTTIVGTGGKVLGYDETDGYIFTNKGIKVGETTRPPFVIESTSLVENLNADLIDDHHASEFPLLSGSNTFTGTNTFEGSVAFPITLVSSDLTLADTHYTILVDASSSNTTITLPDVDNVPNGRVYIIKKVDSSTNAVIVQAQSGQTIDNSTGSYSLSNPFATIVVQAYNGNWYIVGYYGG
jgi:hypothetical protein